MHAILGEPLEEVDGFKCLCSYVATNGIESDVVQKMSEGNKALAAVNCVLSNRGFGQGVKRGLLEANIQGV